MSLRIIVTIIGVLAATSQLAHSIVPPGADTPEFYLISSSANATANLLPVRTVNAATGSWDAVLTGSGDIGKFYFYQGQLTGAPRPSSPSSTLRTLIDSPQVDVGTCATYGALGFTIGSSSNKCARYSTFGIQSNSENSQLGAKLVFNQVGGFYACGSDLTVFYKVSPTDARPDCTPIDLYTLPVV